MVAAGGKDWAQADARSLLSRTRALADIDLADIDLAADGRAELTAIAEFITARQR